MSFMLSGTNEPFMLSVGMVNIVMLSVVMLNVLAMVERRNSDCHYADFRWALFRAPHNGLGSQPCLQILD
jgi:hypothetical protein